MESLLPTQPSSYKTIIKKSLLLYRVSFFRVILISLVFSLVFFIPRFISDMLGYDIFLNVSLLHPHRLWLLLVNFASIIFFISLLFRLYCVSQKKQEPFITDLTIGVKKIIPVVIATLIQTAIWFIVLVAIYGLINLFSLYRLDFHQPFWGMLFTALIYLALIFFIIYLFTLFIFLLPLIAIENKGAFKALERSVYLVWDHWWRVFSVQITPWICFTLLLFILRYFFRIDISIYTLEIPHQYSYWITLLLCLLFAIFIPWIAATLIVQLKELELRKKLTTTLTRHKPKR